MLNCILRLARFIAPLFKTRIGLQAENLALRHQLCVLRRRVKRPTIGPRDRSSSPSRGTQRQSTYFGIEMRYMESDSNGE